MLGNWASLLRGSRMEEVREVDEPRARGRRLRPPISHEFIVRVRTYSSTYLGTQGPEVVDGVTG